jgi:glutathione-dependent peroxiredoxin
MIEIYTKPSCPSCIKTKMFLQSRGLEFTEIRIGKDISREVFLDKYPDTRTVPLVFIDGNKVGGYESVKAYYA